MASAVKQPKGYDVGAKVGFERLGGRRLLLHGRRASARQTSCSTPWISVGNMRDSDGYYVQATWKIPGIGTKIGASFGASKLDQTSTAAPRSGLSGPRGEERIVCARDLSSDDERA